MQRYCSRAAVDWNSLEQETNSTNTQNGWGGDLNIVRQNHLYRWPDTISLIEFPEGYTQYDGRNVWNAMHQETKPKGETTNEDRLLDNIISGLHTTVSLQTILAVPTSWKAQSNKRKLLLERRIANGNVAFIDNLLVLWTLIRQAMVSQALRPYIDSVGGTAVTLRMARFPAAIDSSKLYQGASGQERKIQHLQVFNRITKHIWQIQCDRCLTWGELQLRGVRTMYNALLEPERPLSLGQRTSFLILARQVSTAVSGLDRLDRRLTQSSADIKLFNEASYEREKPTLLQESSSAQYASRTAAMAAVFAFILTLL